jgi:hypothetical protein
MIDDKVEQFISINATGHVFMFCTHEGIKNAKQIRQYEKRAREHLEKIANQGADIQGVEKALKAFLDDLRIELHQADGILEAGLKVKQKPVKPQPISAPEAVKPASAKAGKELGKQAKPVPEKQQSARMEEKLAIQRKPIQELISKECVEFKLLTPERARYWVNNLSGRRVEEVEKDIVDELHQNLHNSVKNFIRKNKKANPWPSPALQEELRMEISQVKTIKGMLMLTSNILWEIRNARKSGKVSLFNRIKKKISG